MKTILIVDDDKVSRVMVRQMIEDMTDEFKVIIFSSGEDLLAELGNLKPDAVICDIEMPGIDGLEVCRRIKADKNRFIPIILITGRRLTRDEIIAGYKSGCDDYIVKPFSADELFARLNPILTIKKLQDRILNENEHLEIKVKKRTQELAISRENYKAMFDNTTAGVCPVNSRGVILDCNNSLISTLKLNYNDIVGKKFCNLFSSVDIEWLKKESLSNLNEDAIIYKAKTVNNSTKYLSLVIKLFTYNDEISYLYITNDITLNINAFNKMKKMTINLATILTQTIEAKDPYTKGHCMRVAALSLSLGKLCSLDHKQLDNLRLGSLFHDIGKIGINKKILNKTGKLSDEEYNNIKQHTIIGENILKNVDFLKPILSMIRGHHERFNGSGYPDGISGKDLTIEERIIAIADVYDALTSSRSYRDPMTTADALKELTKQKCEHFDPMLVDLFIKHRVYERIDVDSLFET